MFPVLSLLSELPSLFPVLSLLSELPSLFPVLSLLSELPSLFPSLLLLSELPSLFPSLLLLSELLSLFPSLLLLSELPSPFSLLPMLSEPLSVGNSVSSSTLPDSFIVSASGVFAYTGRHVEKTFVAISTAHRNVVHNLRLRCFISFFSFSLYVFWAVNQLILAFFGGGARGYRKKGKKRTKFCIRVPGFWKFVIDRE